MRVILRTLRECMRGMMWSVVLVGGIVIGGGIIMAQLSMYFLDGDYGRGKGASYGRSITIR